MAETLETIVPELEQARVKRETTRASLQALLDAGVVESDELALARQTVAKLERMAAELERVEGRLAELGFTATDRVGSPKTLYRQRQSVR